MKTKTKQNGWGHLRGGASRPSRRLPLFRFCFPIFILIFDFSNFDRQKYNADDNYIDDNHILGAREGDSVKYF